MFLFPFFLWRKNETWPIPKIPIEKGAIGFEQKSLFGRDVKIKFRHFLTEAKH